MNDCNIFFERVKALCKDQHLNLRTLIESCEINYDSYNSYKRYGNYPRADEALRIAKALKSNVEYLVTGKESGVVQELTELKKKILSFAQSVQ